MSEKLIIENRSNLPMSRCLKLAQAVVYSGRVSNHGKQYCYLTIFNVLGRKIGVSSFLNAKSDRFVITETD